MFELVCACADIGIFCTVLPLISQAEYLFVKADRLRSVANRFVRVLNEAQMLNNLQVLRALCAFAHSL